MTFETNVGNCENSDCEVDDTILFCELLAETHNKKKKLFKKNIIDKESTDIGPIFLREGGRKGNDYINITISNYDEMMTSCYDYEALVKFRNKLNQIIKLFEWGGEWLMKKNQQ